MKLSLPSISNLYRLQAYIFRKECGRLCGGYNKCQERCSFGYGLLPYPSANFHTSNYKSYQRSELTAKRYAVSRGSFSEVTESDIKFFKNLLEEHRVITGVEELEGNNTDWIGMVRGYSSLLLKPKTTEEVSKILSYCNSRNLAVCPQGGNTGLVGAGVPVFDEVIISMSLMNRILNIDDLSGVLTCESGCVLESLEQAVAKHGLIMPIDLGAKGSCQIGGNISTNAGGMRVLRYGSLHGSVLGVEAVLASGEVVDCLSTLKKDNTGYDLKQLFIGSEGTLGIVTKITIQCPSRPLASSVAFLSLNQFDNVLKTYKEAKVKLAEILTSCEMIDHISLDAARTYLNLPLPLEDSPFYMILETAGSNGAHDEEKLMSFLEDVLENGTVKDGTIASEPSKMAAIWALRERLAEALLIEGYAYKYDLSLPLDVYYEVVEIMQKRLGSKVLRCCGYGHIGDGNLHFNATTKRFDEEVLSLIEPFIYELTAKHNGSISAEHGLGFIKRKYIRYSKNETAVTLMRQIKALMDPNGILNPYKVIPEE